MKVVSAIFTLVFGALFLTWAGVRIVDGIRFDQQCEGHIKRAADANSIELAKVELHTVTAYLEANHLTSGYTSLLWRTPDEDVAFWYSNIKAAEQQVDAISPDASNLERSNMLIKLRETLLDHGQDGDHVTAPDGITIYPENGLFAVWGLGSFLAAILCGIITIVVWFEY